MRRVRARCSPETKGQVSDVRFTLTPLVTVEEMDRAVEQSADLPVPGKE